MRSQMTMRFQLVTLTLRFLLCITLVTISWADWCQKRLGCYCKYREHESLWKCKSENGSRSVANVFLPSHDLLGDWHMECLTGQLSDLQSLNFSLGNVKQLSLVHCGNNLYIPYADLLRSWSVQGLEELRIDMGEKSISRPLMTQAFIGLQELYPDLKALDLQRVSFMDPHLLYHLGNLTKLIIHSCKNILSFPQNFLAPLKHLEHLEVFGNPDLRIIPSGFFDTNIHLKVVNMSSNRLELFTSGMFSNLVNLQELVLNHNYFQAVPPDLFAHNAKLKILRWNQDYCSYDAPCNRTFHPGLFSATQNLETFEYSIKQSLLGEIDRVFFQSILLPRTMKRLKIVGTKSLTWPEVGPLLERLANLEDLSLAHNNITFRDEFLNHLPGLLSLDLTGNWLACNQCRTIKLQGLQIDKCWEGNSTQQELKHPSQMETVLIKYCNSYKNLKVYAIAGVLGCFATLLFLVVISACISERLRVRLYHHKFFAKFFLPESDFGAKEYDVFISYAEADEDLAIALSEKLEGKATTSTPCTVAEPLGRTFKCCLHQRDWTAGREISLNIVDSVSKSRRTVIILSPAFLKSSYCLQEFNQAYAQNRLLVVMRVNLSTNDVSVSNNDIDEAHFDAIRNYIQTFTYLREDDMDFWGKLVYRLPHKRMSPMSRVVKTGNDAKRRISELRRLISHTSREEDDQVEDGNRSRPPSFQLTTANA